MQNSTHDWKQLKKVKVSVPYSSPGNSIRHIPVKFEVFFDGRKGFRAISNPDEQTSKLISIPSPLDFEVNNGWVTCQNPSLNYVALDIYNASKDNLQ